VTVLSETGIIKSGGVMSENKNSKIVLPSGGVFNELLLRIKLILRLMGDSRVSPLIKLLPVGTVVYFLFPDLLPGPIDDAAIMWLGAYLFVELCPPEVVQEHMDALRLVVPGELRDAPTQPPKVVNETPPQENQPPRQQVIDADFRDPQE
jgi:hypothetical protein